MITKIKFAQTRTLNYEKVAQLLPGNNQTYSTLSSGIGENLKKEETTIKRH